MHEIERRIESRRLRMEGRLQAIVIIGAILAFVAGWLGIGLSDSVGSWL